jgi:hypothetical protein
MKGILQIQDKANKTIIVLLTFFALAVAPACGSNSFWEQFLPTAPPISGDQAQIWVIEQVQFGPRIPGSEAHDKFISWAVEKLQKWDWKVEVQSSMKNHVPIRNIIAKKVMVYHGLLLVHIMIHAQLLIMIQIPPKGICQYPALTIVDRG